MKKTVFILYIFIILSFSGSICFAELTSGKFINNPDVDNFTDFMVKKHKFDRKYLEDVFAQTMHSGFTPKYMNKPAETVNTWDIYKKNMLHEIRVRNGVEYFKKHRDELMKAQDAYGVPAHIIAGVIGVETNYGKAPIKFRAIDAISTLAFYYPRRAKYFQGELEALFLFARKTDTDIFSIKSSYAGAIGIPQFMPSNVLRYAVSGSGDKHIDIINNHLDALYSVANFISEKGWNKNEPVFVKVQVKGDKYEKYVTERPCRKEKVLVEDLKKAGVVFPFYIPNDLKGNLYTVQGINGREYLVGFNNFCAIFRYNPSIHYVMGVNFLGNIVSMLAEPSLEPVKTKQK